MQNIQSSIFQNIKSEEGIASILLRILFLMIFFCNMPFVFFAGKGYLMAVIHQIFYKKDVAETTEVEQNENQDEGY